MISYVSAAFSSCSYARFVSLFICLLNDILLRMLHALYRARCWQIFAVIYKQRLTCYTALPSYHLLNSINWNHSTSSWLFQHCFILLCLYMVNICSWCGTHAISSWVYLLVLSKEYCYFSYLFYTCWRDMF